MSRPALLAGLAALLVTGAGGAAAQTRDRLPPVGTGEARAGMPAVNPRRIAPDPDEPLYRAFADFGAWARSAGSPRILLFWNRELSEDAATRERTVERGVGLAVSAPGAAAGGWERTVEQQRTTGGRFAALHPEDSSILESGFVSAFLGTGANVVDRNALMRKVSAAKGSADRHDTQFIESLALEQGVDYLVEVLPIPDGGSDTGFTFQVKITHLPSSAVRAQFRTSALPAPGPRRLEAVPGGFEARRDSRNTRDRVADQLASETMRRFR